MVPILSLLAVPGATNGQDTMAGYLQEEYSCIMCHTEMRTDFLEGVHADRGIQCTDCHGGDPSQFETEANADMHEATTAREILGDFEGERLS